MGTSATHGRRTGQNLILGFQHLFAMFGSTVLVPLLTGLNPAVAVCTAGIGTLLFHWITGGKVPVFLGSSFAFIGVMVAAASRIGGLGAEQDVDVLQAAYQDALPYVSLGITCAGALYLILALLVKLLGPERVMAAFPPVVTGPMIIVIGLTLAPTAFNNITAAPDAGLPDELWMRWTIALLVILTMVCVSIFARGFFRLVPIIAAIGVGYAAAALMGQVDFSSFASEPLGFQIPPFQCFIKRASRIT